MQLKINRSFYKLFFSTVLLPTAVFAQQQYDVTITNLTAQQMFTPRLVVSHRPSISLFTLGAVASAELRTLAEEGNTQPFEQALAGSPRVSDSQVGAGLLAAGASQTVRITARGNHVLSLAAMLIPTNDAFVGLNSAALPVFGSVSYMLQAYDSGTEVNDELCTSIPGPNFTECGGPGGGAQVGGGEGFVHVSRGMFGVGNFMSSVRDWKNPVARVTVTRVAK